MNPTTVANTSVTYVPRSTGFESCTIHYDTDGLRHIVTGCRGTYTISLNANQIPDFNSPQQYTALTDRLTVFDFDDQADPRSSMTPTQPPSPFLQPTWYAVC